MIWTESIFQQPRTQSIPAAIHTSSEKPQKMLTSQRRMRDIIPKSGAILLNRAALVIN